MKAGLKQIAGRMGFEIRRTAHNQQDELARRYVREGAVPWSAGYAAAKEQFVSRTLRTPDLMEAFRAGGKLPDGYGVGFDERCVEYPWLLALLGESNQPILDAGSVLNHAFILDHVAFEKKKLHILTLAPENQSFWNQGISYLFADLREIPIRDGYYEHVACISTLEHVGCDNSKVSGLDIHRENRLDDFTNVMGELNRVLKPGGTLYLSVPFGVHRNFGSFQIFDSAMVARAIAAFGSLKEATKTFYRYAECGWNLATEGECAGSEFAEWVVKMWRDGTQPKDAVVDPDRAAAARAVACVRIVKA